MEQHPKHPRTPASEHYRVHFSARVLGNTALFRLVIHLAIHQRLTEEWPTWPHGVFFESFTVSPPPKEHHTASGHLTNPPPHRPPHRTRPLESAGAREYGLSTGGLRDAHEPQAGEHHAEEARGVGVTSAWSASFFSAKRWELAG